MLSEVGVTRRRSVTAVFVVLVLVVLGAGLAGCTKAGDFPSDAMAVVGQNIITQAQFDARLAEIEKQYPGRVPTKDGDPAAYKEFQTLILNYLVEVGVVQQEAVNMNISVTDEEVQAQIDGIKQWYMGDDAQFEAALKEQNLTLDVLKRSLREQELTRKVFAEVTKDATVSADQVQAYFDSHQEEFTLPETRLARHILFMPKNTSDPSATATEADWASALALADKVRKEIVDGADFGEKAKQYSDDPGSRDLGGDLGVVERGRMVPEFEEATFALKKFDISQPVKTQFGYHLIQVTDITESKVQPLEDVKEQITQILLEQEQRKLWDAWLAKVKAELGVQYKAGFEPVTTTTVVTTNESITTSTSGQ